MLPAAQRCQVPVQDGGRCPLPGGLGSTDKGQDVMARQCHTCKQAQATVCSMLGPAAGLCFLPGPPCPVAPHTG